jgi:hypothetical protein
MGSPPWSPYPRPPQYEFTQEENETLDELAVWSGGLAIVKFIQGGLGILGQNPLGAMAEVIVGVSLMSARKALRSAVTTEGNDIDHLLQAVDKLSTVFLVRWIIAIIIVVVLALLVVAVVALAASGETLDLSGV